MADDFSHMEDYEKAQAFGKEEVDSHPLVAEWKTLENLAESYKDNPLFLSKIEDMRSKGASYRAMRPDGSCFYRAYGLGLCERAMSSPDAFTALRSKAEKGPDFACDAGYERMAVEIFFESWVEYMDELKTAGPGGVTDLWSDDTKSKEIIFALRTSCSSYLKHHQEEFSAYLDGFSSIEDFCRMEVLPMGREADQLQVMAVTSYFGVPVRIHYLDQSPGSTCAEHTIPEGIDGVEPIPLLYRPGHYDLLRFS
jgi:ubiquitin thioesterase protein OTUB1